MNRIDSNIFTAIITAIYILGAVGSYNVFNEKGCGTKQLVKIIGATMVWPVSVVIVGTGVVVFGAEPFGCHNTEKSK